jgi:hypothetical protein
MQRPCTRTRRLSSTAILSDTFAPPRIVRNGFSGEWSSRDRNSTSRSSRKPPAFSFTNAAMPAVDACARCAAPKASFT